MSDEIDQIAENLYESIGGSLCICQRTDVFHWCESCQRRCGLIAQALRDQYAKGRAESRSECVWINYDDYDMWETSCGQAYSIIEGTPGENAMAYCCFCGSRLKELIPAPEEAP